MTDAEAEWLLADGKAALDLIRKLTGGQIRYTRLKYEEGRKGEFQLMIRGQEHQRIYANDCLNLILQSHRQFGPVPSAKDVVQEQLDKEAARTGQQSSEQQHERTPPAVTQDEKGPTKGQFPYFMVLENDNDKRSSSVRIRNPALLCLDKFSEFCKLSPEKGGLNSVSLSRETPVTAILVLYGHEDARRNAVAALEEDMQSQPVRSLSRLSCDILFVLPHISSQIPRGPNGLMMTFESSTQIAYLRHLPKFLYTLDDRHWIHISGSRRATSLAKDELRRLQAGGTQQVLSQQDADEQYPVAQIESNAGCKENLKSLMRKAPSPVFLITSMPKSNNKATRGRRAVVDDFRGMTVSSFSTVTIEPQPVVCFNVKEPSRTLAAILSSGRFYVHLLAANGAGAALSDLFTKPYETPAEPFLRASELTQANLVASHNGPRFSGRAVVGALYCSILYDKTVTVGDHKVIFANVDAATPWDQSWGPRGLIYVHRSYKAEGAGVQRGKVTDKALDPVLYQQRVSDNDETFCSEHKLMPADATSVMEDDPHSRNDEIDEQSFAKTDVNLSKQANTDAMTSYFEDMERVERENDDADIESEDVVNSADVKSEGATLEDATESPDASSESATENPDAKSEDAIESASESPENATNSADVKSDAVAAEDGRSGDMKSENETESDESSEYSDDIAPRLPEEEVRQNGAAETDLAPGYKPDLPKDERR